MDVLALVEAPDHVCCRYRVRAFEAALRRAGATLRIEGLASGLANRVTQLQRARWYDVVLLQRKLMPRWQSRWLRRWARHLVFDFDDAVLYRDSYNARGPHCAQRRARFTELMGLADVVLAGNGFLAECATRHGAAAEKVRIMPTCVDTDRLPATAYRDDKGPIDLVWVGSSSTLQGLERDRETLEAIGRAVPGARLKLICDRFARFDPLEVVPIVWSEAIEDVEIASGMIGISLVPDDHWSRGKCGLKLLQYRGCGLPVVASPVGVHRTMVETGVDGYLASGPSEWVTAVRALAGDSGLRRRMGERARAATVRDYSVRAWSERFVEFLVPPRPSAGRPRGRRGPGTVAPRTLR